MTCRGKGSQTELAGCTWNGKEAEQRINTDLTESSKSPASIAQSNKQWVGIIQDAEGKVTANRHNGPNQALRQCARHGIEQCCNVQEIVNSSKKI